MTFDLFLRLYQEAKSYDNLDMYIMERGWQDWMDDYQKSSESADASAIVSVLTDIYDMANGGVNDLCEKAGIGMKSLANLMQVPYPTMQRWKASGIPERDKMMIAFAIVNNKTHS